ncbi:helix-turn-helix transcriptional regulator [Actinoplanes sp. G11-F43]|uniref:helix-turn-helix transcriptional regulator n=1 Tax=Actinoplanes sp. G11-F43 TaxID=3424130 RepID=UPI003D330D6C
MSARYNLTLYSGKAITLNWAFEGTSHAAMRWSDRVVSPAMDETSGELPDDWWTTDLVLDYLRSVGAEITRPTWAAYVSRGQAPAPDRMFGRSPAWRPATIREWQASRPRRGSA